jgi:hypothetical protein
VAGPPVAGELGDEQMVRTGQAVSAAGEQAVTDRGSPVRSV